MWLWTSLCLKSCQSYWFKTTTASWFSRMCMYLPFFVLWTKRYQDVNKINTFSYCEQSRTNRTNCIDSKRDHIIPIIQRCNILVNVVIVNKIQSSSCAMFRHMYCYGNLVRNVTSLWCCYTFTISTPGYLFHLWNHHRNVRQTNFGSYQKYSCLHSLE